MDAETTPGATLALPYDVAPSPGLRSVMALHAWGEWVPDVGDATPLAVLVAALAVVLARTGGQAELLLGVWRAPGWGRGLTLATAGELPIGRLLADVQRQLDASSDLATFAPSEARVRWHGAAPPAVAPDDDLTPLTLDAWQVGDRVHARWRYDQARLHERTVARLGGHLREALAGVRPDGATPLLELPLVTAAERAWLAEVSEGPPRTMPDPRLHTLIEAHARTRPDAIAVRHGERVLTYRELNRRANALARDLRRHGVDAERRVAVCVEPSVDIAVALLAIFKAGGVYVPVEPTYPAARIAAILDECAPPVLICRDGLAERLGLTAPVAGRVRLSLEAPPTVSAADDADLDVVVQPTQAASIYYTSGTTGRPKGVVATHANVTTYILTAQRRYAIDHREVMPAIARFSFSISMFELMSPLAAGGTLVVLDREHVMDLPRLAATLRDVTFFHAGPSLLRNLLPVIEASGQAGAPYAGVRHASSGGDLIAPEILERLKRVFPAAEVFVIYGCSEISCMGCTYPVPRDAVVTRTYVGRPFEDVAVRIVDGAGRQVPAGVVGEIEFAGGGLTRGYLDRPELVAEKFVTRAGRRWYRTGDLGRLSADGWVEILGRNDFQIKLRGMRLELGEVEVHLRAAPGVRDAVAMGKPGPSGEPILVGYVVLQPGADASPAAARARAGALRRHMADRVPDYMVPAAFVELPALPLNHNMKVDRFALPAPPSPASLARPAPAPSDAPVTPTERTLAAAWQRLLALPAVSVGDNFFDLGGDSLRAQEFIAGVEAELGVRLLGMDVLRESLEVLAGLIDAARGAAAPPPARRARPVAAQATSTNFHFGPDDTLYGVLHHAAAAGDRAVLVCGAVGQEQVRAHFVLGRLGRALALAGVPTLRFDYYGVGDSLGDGPVASVARWQRDVAAAAAELRRQTGARHVIGVGVRLGALLLETARAEVQPSRLVHWDPVTCGATYFAELAAMQRRHVAGTAALRRGRPIAPRPGRQALVGTEFTAMALHELRRLTVAPRQGAAAHAALPTAWLISADRDEARARHAALHGAGVHLAELDLDCGWTDVTRMEDILSDAGFSRRLAALVLGQAEEPAA